MKTNAIIRIVVFSLLIVLLLAVLAAGFGLSDYFINRISGNLGSLQGGTLSSGSVPAEQVTNLEIQWVSGSITILPADTDTISFSEPAGFSTDKQMVWKLDGSKLIIQFCKETWFDFPSFSIGKSDYSKDLTITVPRDWNCGSLDIESVSASIQVTELTAREVDLDNVSGECRFDNCNVRELTSESVSGALNYSGTVQKLEMKTVSAGCTATLDTAPDEVRLNSVSGSITLYLPEDAGFRASLDSMSGRITSDFATTAQNGCFSYGDESCRITADSVSGDVIIRKHP